MLTLGLIGLTAILLLTLRPTRRQAGYQLVLLAGATRLALEPTQWLAVSGLAYFGLHDWHTRTVPAWPFDAWCLAMLATASANRPLAAAWLVLLTLLAMLTRGLGSADILAIAAVAPALGASGSLTWVLLACLTGIMQGLFRPGPLPLLTHLHLAYLVTLWLL